MFRRERRVLLRHYAVGAPSASVRGAGAGAAVRDAAGAVGPGLRRVRPAVGQAARAGGGAGVLADAPVLRAADDGDGGSGSGGGVRVLRGRALDTLTTSAHHSTCDERMDALTANTN